MNCKLNLIDIKNVIKIGKLIEVAIEANNSFVTMYGCVRFGKEKMLYVEKTVEGNDIDPGSIVIDSKVMKLLNGQSIAINSNTLICGDRTIYIDNNTSGQHENMDELNFNECVTLEFDEFKEATEIIYAAEKINLRPQLNCLCLDDEYLIALDGYMLAKRKLNIKIHEQILIPIHAIEAIRRVKVSNKKASLQILANENYIKFYIPEEGLILISDRVNEKYVNYQSLIPTEFKTEVRIDSKIIYQIAKGYLDSGFEQMYFDFKENTTIHSKMLGFKVKDKITVDHRGNELKICVKSSFFVKALKKYKGEISINMNSNVTPLYIKQDNKEELILPVRVVNEAWEESY